MSFFTSRRCYMSFLFWPLSCFATILVGSQMPLLYSLRTFYCISRSFSDAFWSRSSWACKLARLLSFMLLICCSTLFEFWLNNRLSMISLSRVPKSCLMLFSVSIIPFWMLFSF